MRFPRPRFARATMLPLLVLSIALAPMASRAAASPFSARAHLAVGSMVSKDQLNRLRYDSPALLAGAAASAKVAPWLSTQWWIRGATFFAAERNGAVLGTTLGLRVHSTEREVVPYVSLDVGAALTGTLVRPSYGASLGVDWRVRDTLMVGPVGGFDQVIQWNKRGYSSDAMYFWIGLAVAYDRKRPAARLSPRPRPLPATPTANTPKTEQPAQDDAELAALIERTVSSEVARVELLAPVLFALNSAELEPIGVAMLHEVAYTLRVRPEIRRLEIEGYADRRGDAQHNIALSQRRAERVRDWLIAQGIAAHRLTIAAHGASTPVDEASSERAHEQNRRVVFRVLELGPP